MFAMISIMITVAYVIGAIISYNYWKTSLHIGTLCNRPLGHTCDDACWLAASGLCIIWPISPFVWIGYKVCYRVINYLIRIGKKLGSVRMNQAKKGL